MVTVEELQAKFNGLVPTGVAYTLDELVAGSKDDVDDVCKEWGLKGTKATTLKYLYNIYPSVLAASQQSEHGESIDSQPQPDQGK